MQIQVLKSSSGKSNKSRFKLYRRSITIDENLLEASNIIEGEKFL
jgi:aspartate 1-decarboxylase